jgi:phage gpG-like protein
MMDISVFPDDQMARQWMARLISAIGKTQAGSADYANLLSTVVFRDVIDHFQAEEGSDGPWTAWSDVYARHMQSIGKAGNKILQNSGRLKQAFTPASWRSVTGGILWYNPAKTKSGFPYAKAHDEGGPVLPKRDFMWLSDDARERLAGLTLQFILSNESEA